MSAFKRKPVDHRLSPAFRLRARVRLTRGAIETMRRQPGQPPRRLLAVRRVGTVVGHNLPYMLVRFPGCGPLLCHPKLLEPA